MNALITRRRLSTATLALIILVGCAPEDLSPNPTSLTMQTGTLPVATTNESYDATIIVSGGVPPYAVRRSRGDDWPAGIGLDSNTSTISGAPQTGSGGAYFVDIEVTDSDEPPTSVERRLALVVSEKGNEFAAIRSWVLPTCMTSACHSAQSHAGELVLESDTAYANLINISPQNIVAASADMLLVAPGDAARSFLIHKLTGELSLGEGTVMPQAGVHLPDEQVALVRQWIEEGAQPPPGETPGGPGDEPGEQETSLEVGETVEQIFEPVEDGGNLRLWFGTQGGVWVSPTIRATGLDTSVRIDAQLVAADGVTVLGETTLGTIMTPTLQGTERQNVLIPVSEGEDVEHLYNTTATLSFHVIDDEGHEVSLTLQVTLVPG